MIEIAKSLRPKFDADNPKDTPRKMEQKLEILTIHHKRRRVERMEDTRDITEAM